MKTMKVAKRNICGDLKPGFNFSKVKKNPQQKKSYGQWTTEGTDPKMHQSQPWNSIQSQLSGTAY